MDFCISNGLEDIQIARDDLCGIYHGGMVGGKSRPVGTTTRGSNYRRYVCPKCGNIARTTNEMAAMMMDCINNMMIDLYASMAQTEIEKKEKRQREGIAAKRQRGE